MSCAVSRELGSGERWSAKGDVVTGFSAVNLLEVENSVGDRAPGVEGRFGRKHLDSRDLGVSLFRYAPNLRSPFAHSHREQEEAYVVVAGSGRMLLDDDVRDVRQWDVVRVAPEVVRAFEAGPDGLDIIAIGGPKPADGDGVPGTAEWPDAK
jgi:quercetin dioxygenase-like cupin family protein